MTMGRKSLMTSSAVAMVMLPSLQLGEYMAEDKKMEVMATNDISECGRVTSVIR